MLYGVNCDSHSIQARLASGRETLHAFRLTSPSATRARIAILHGYGEHGGRYLPFMQWLHDRRIAAATIDFRGQGRSTGRRAYVRRWDDLLDDVNVFLDWESKTAPLDAPLFVLGHSHGALVAAAGVIRGRLQADGFIFCSPFFRPRFTVPRSKRALGMIGGSIVPWIRVRTGLREAWLNSDQSMVRESRSDPLMVRAATPRWFTGMLKVQEEVTRRAPEFAAPLLCLTGSADGVADPAAAAEFVRRSTSPDKTLREYNNLRHELLREISRERVFDEILQWLTLRLAISPRDS